MSSLGQSLTQPPSAPTAPSAEQARWFAAEVHPHDAQLKAWLKGNYPGVRDVDDVVQESYLRIWKARAAHPIDSAKALLFTIARHLAIRTSQRNARAPVKFVGDLTQLGIIDSRPTPAEVLGYQEKISLLAEALSLLPNRCREVVILRKLQGLPQKEVAAQLCLSERTVENQLAKGTERCRVFFVSRGVDQLF